eukprot:177507-Lingulodinium_polyedra.AAC.1
MLNLREAVNIFIDAYAATKSTTSSSSSGSRSLAAYPKVAHFTPAQAKALMPKIPYCYLVEQPSQSRLYAKYPNCIPGSTQASTSSYSEA